ncbi:MAG: ketoacyl-ACP synthase III [Deltaproteobacteria bacterium]|nr:ketoacyl-ACP synthase III [Deltaproteobacteria bacterium]
MRAVIRGTGSSVPDRKITNADLEKLVETNDEWIVARTGIRERGMLEEGEATSDLATRAARAALEMAGCEPSELDLIVVSTMTPDMFCPSVAALVQRNLECERPIPCFDLNAACSGFGYGLQVCWDFIAAGRYRRILLIGAEGLTRFMDYEDRGTCILFGDGAGAVVLEATDKERGLVASNTRADGKHWDLIQIPGGAAAQPASPDMIAQRLQYVRMNGRATFKLAVQTMEQVARDTLKDAGWSLDDVDHLLVHQANQRIIEAVIQRLEIPLDKVPINIEHTGNTSAASIGILLDECNREGRFSEGDKLLFVAFGSGLTWSASALEWSPTGPRG